MVGVVGLVDMMGLVSLVVMGGRVGRHVVVRLQSGQLVHLEGSEGKEWFLSNKPPTPTYHGNTIVKHRCLGAIPKFATENELY